MSNVLPEVEVRFPVERTSLRGVLTRLDSSTATVRVADSPSPSVAVVPGTPAEIIAVTACSIYLLATRVLAQFGRDMEMDIESPLRTIQRPEEEHYVCEVPVSFRAVHSDGFAGAWKQAIATDIGPSGLHMIASERVGVAARLELRIYALTPADVASGQAISAEDRSPIKGFARVAHCARAHEGLLSIAVAYSGVRDTDRPRIARLAQHLFDEPTPVAAHRERLRFLPPTDTVPAPPDPPRVAAPAAPQMVRRRPRPVRVIVR